MKHSEETLREFQNLKNRGLSIVEAGRRLNLTAGQAKGLARRLRNRPAEPESYTPVSRFEITEQEDQKTIWSVSDSVRTVDDAIAKAEIDLDVWEVTKTTVNSYPTSMKLATGSRKTGDYVETPHQVWNWQINIELRRRAPQFVQDGITALLDRLPPTSLAQGITRRARSRKQTGVMLEIALYDTHFAKLCWRKETGTDYDLKIADEIFANAVADTLEATSHVSVNRILFPIGNDFFHANNWRSETAKGTVVQSVDDRPAKVFQYGVTALERAIEQALQVAPVELVWIPGNHDPETSWYLSQVLKALYRETPDVLVDDSPMVRKYYRHGVVLLGLAHGDNVKAQQFPMLMATESPDFSACSVREVHLGHLHKKQEWTMVGDEHNGVRVRRLPSLAGTDNWHFEHGFTQNRRAAESYLWSADDGYLGHVSVNAQHLS